MWNVVWIGDCSTDGVLWCNSGFGECIITRIEIFPLPLHLGQDVLVCWKLAVQSKELLLLLRQFTDVDLVALERQHGEVISRTS